MSTALIFCCLFSKEDQETSFCKLQFTHGGLKSHAVGGEHNQKRNGASP